MRCGLVLLLAGLILSPETASAQDPDDHRGGRITIQLRDTGRPLTGRLTQLNDEKVTLIRDGRELTVPLARVSRIDLTVRDPTWNGTLIGAVAMGAWCAFICRQGLDRPSDWTRTLLGGAVSGAMIGYVIDASRSGTRVLYRAASDSTRRSPGGVYLAWRF